MKNFTVSLEYVVQLLLIYIIGASFRSVATEHSRVLGYLNWKGIEPFCISLNKLYGYIFV